VTRKNEQDIGARTESQKNGTITEGLEFQFRAFFFWRRHGILTTFHDKNKKEFISGKYCDTALFVA